MTALVTGRLDAGLTARVRVPATSANLGPGFDCMGLAVDWYDELQASTTASGLSFELSGEGAEQVPRDGSHLVVATLRDGLASLGAQADGLHLAAHNTIPHSRGLGSSAAAIVGGLALAWGLARPGSPLDLDWLAQLSSRAEGHPDNACAAVYGGVVLAWQESERYEVVRLDPADGLRATVWVPAFEVPTSGARGVLPDLVPRLDAVAQATSAAALVHALTADPTRLHFATRDRLHQDYRAELMRPSADLVARLREAGQAAVVSGAGPTVLALGTQQMLQASDSVACQGFVRHDLALGRGVELLQVG